MAIKITVGGAQQVIPNAREIQNRIAANRPQLIISNYDPTKDLSEAVWADSTAKTLYDRIGSDGARISDSVNNHTNYPRGFSSLTANFFNSLLEPYLSKSTTQIFVSKLYYFYSPAREQSYMYRGTYDAMGMSVKATYSSSSKTFTLSNVPTISIPSGTNCFVGMTLSISVVPPSPFISVKTYHNQEEILNATEDRIALYSNRQIGIQLSDGGKPKFSISVSGSQPSTFTLY